MKTSGRGRGKGWLSQLCLSQHGQSCLFGLTIILGAVLLSTLLFYPLRSFNLLPHGVITWGNSLLASISTFWLASLSVVLSLFITFHIKCGIPLWVIEGYYRRHILIFSIVTAISWSLFAVGANDLLTDSISFIKKIESGIGIPKIVIIIIGSLLLLFLSPHGLLWAIRIKLFWRHDYSILRCMDKFFASAQSQRKSSSEWFHLVHLASGAALADRYSQSVLWVNPASYMNLHAAAALLANRYYYSCLKTPDSVWNFLVSHGSSRYARILLSRELKSSKRYVFCDDLSTAQKLTAIRNFLADESDEKKESFPVAVREGLKEFAVKKSASCFSSVHDFSVFSIDEGWIIIEMHPKDEERVARTFDELDRSLDRRKQFEDRLANIPFRAVIRFTRATSASGYARPLDDKINRELDLLEAESDKRQILPCDLNS